MPSNNGVDRVGMEAAIVCLLLAATDTRRISRSSRGESSMLHRIAQSKQNGEEIWPRLGSLSSFELVTFYVESGTS